MVFVYKHGLWSSDEIETLKKCYIIDRMRPGDISRTLNRTISSVKQKAVLLKLRRKRLYDSRLYNKERVSSITDLHSQGFTNRKISRLLKIHHSTVNNYVKQLGLRPNGDICQQIDVVNGNHARCSKCGLIKELGEFLKNRVGQKYEYRFSYCLDCRRKQVYENLNGDITKFLNERYRRLRIRCRMNGQVLGFSREYLKQLYDDQHGRCFYFGIEMVCTFGKGMNTKALSVDRIIPRAGYVKGNVVLCTLRANSIKSNLNLLELKIWIPKWYRKAMKHLTANGLAP
jgi:hypothetical protein